MNTQDIRLRNVRCLAVKKTRHEKSQSDLGKAAIDSFGCRWHGYRNSKYIEIVKPIFVANLDCSLLQPNTSHKIREKEMRNAPIRIATIEPWDIKISWKSTSKAITLLLICCDARREFLREIHYKNLFCWHLWRFFPYCWVKFTQVCLANFLIHISLNYPCGGY